MAKREWLSHEHRIFRHPGGKVYARPNVPGLGRKEFPLGKSYLGDLSSIDPKTLKGLIQLKDRKVADLLRAKAPIRADLARLETLGLEIVESKKKKAEATFSSADLHINLHLIPWANRVAPYFYEWEERGETLWQQYIDEKRAIRPDMKFLNHRKHLRMILLRAFERGIIKRKVSLYDPDPEIDVGRVLSHDEVKSLYQVSAPTLRVQILMAFTMGFRKSEILRLEWSRVDFDKNEIILLRKNTKTRRPRVIPMNQWVRGALLARWKKRVGPYVFWSRYDQQAYQRSNKTAWGRAKVRAGLKARFHDLRHTFITNAVRSGLNPVLICKYAGVSQEVMASVYCHLDTSDLNQLAIGFGGKMGDLVK